jgi:phospholipid-binding lipoprotein MlaA
MQKISFHFPRASLLAMLTFATLILGGCAASSDECYPETGFVDPHATHQGEAYADEMDDPFADDPFADDPFGDEDEEGSSFEVVKDGHACLIHTEAEEVLDPIEPLNRSIFWINDKLYTFVLKPVARTYRFAIPEPARQGIGNFFSNLTSPVRALNSFLQLKFNDAAEEICRFTINSTVGVLGFIDVAGKNGLRSKQEDMGQTFGRYGVGHGFYLVLPFFGPSSARDAVGRVGDFFVDPTVWAVQVDPWTRLGISATNTVNAISLDKDTYEALIKESLDPYATMRSGYLQMRKAKVAR